MVGRPSLPQTHHQTRDDVRKLTKRVQTTHCDLRADGLCKNGLSRDDLVDAGVAGRMTSRERFVCKQSPFAVSAVAPPSFHGSPEIARSTNQARAHRTMLRVQAMQRLDKARASPP
jgi:hypothetical protein